MEEWKEYKLGDVLTIKYGKDHKQLADGDIPIYGSGGIMRYGERSLYDGPSILIPRKGSLNNVIYADKPFWTVDTMFWSIINDSIANPLFVYYSICKKDFASLNVGSAVPSLTVPVIEDIDILLPPKATQDKVVSILKSLDDKIELNRHINHNLEAMAKQLYDYWFMQFDFPDENGKPYKSSGGKMVWNKKLKREIPEGWRIDAIGNILDKYPTTKRYETKEYLKEGKNPIVDQGDTYIVGFTNEDDNLLTRIPAVLFGDHSTKVKLLDFVFARGADGTQILYSNNPNVSQYYLYMVISSLQIPNPGYSRHFKYLKELPIIIPESNIVNAFTEVISPLFKQRKENIFSNITLIKQRNELLPLLMNGQASPQNCD